VQLANLDVAGQQLMLGDCVAQNFGQFWFEIGELMIKLFSAHKGNWQLQPEDKFHCGCR